MVEYEDSAMSFAHHEQGITILVAHLHELLILIYKDNHDEMETITMVLLYALSSLAVIAQGLLLAYLFVFLYSMHIKQCYLYF